MHNQDIPKIFEKYQFHALTKSVFASENSTSNIVPGLIASLMTTNFRWISAVITSKIIKFLKSHEHHPSSRGSSNLNSLIKLLDAPCSLLCLSHSRLYLLSWVLSSSKTSFNSSTKRFVKLFKEFRLTMRFFAILSTSNGLRNSLAEVVGEPSQIERNHARAKTCY